MKRARCDRYSYRYRERMTPREIHRDAILEAAENPRGFCCPNPAASMALAREYLPDDTELRIVHLLLALDGGNAWGIREEACASLRTIGVLTDRHELVFTPVHLTTKQRSSP